MYHNLEQLKQKAPKLIDDNLQTYTPKKPKKKVVEAVKEVMKPLVTPAPVVNVKTDSKDVVKAVKQVSKSIKPFDDKKILNALYQVADAVQEAQVDIDLTPLIQAVKEAKTEIDLEPVIEALRELKDERVDERNDALADRFEKAIKTFGGIVQTTIVGGVNSGKVVNRNGQQINPATEEKQDSTISLLTNGTAIKAADSPSIDAFARWRTSEPTTLFDSKQLYDASPLFWDDQEVSGGGTSSSHSTATASTTMTVSATTAGKRVRQTFMRFNYQPGKSQLIFLTGTLAVGGGAGITRAMGLFDDNNGLFFKDNEGTIQVVKRSSASGSPVDTAVSQSSWNLDKLDGTGASGITLDASKSQIGIIDFEWLGVGRVRMGFVFDGVPVYCHEFNHANNAAGVYMSTPNLPLRYEIENDGTGVESTLEHICSSVESEGGVEDNGVVRYTSTANTQVDCAAVGSLYAVKGLRLKSTHLSATVKVISAGISVQSAGDDIEWILVFNPTIAGTPSWANETNSAIQSFTGATAHTVTGGTQVTGGYLSTGTGLNSFGSISFEIPNALLLGSAIDGTQQTVVLCAKPLTNVNTLVEGSITWRELL